MTFTVDAYPKDVFKGRIAQVRLNPTTVSERRHLHGDRGIAQRRS